MEVVNPYQSPQTFQPRRGRRRFKWLCLISLVFAGLGIVAGIAISPWRNDDASPLLLIFDGLLALGELLAFTLAAIGGVGWVVSPRPVSEHHP